MKIREVTFCFQLPVLSIKYKFFQEVQHSISLQQVVEKRYERRQDKAKFDEKTEFIPINEYFEENFNAVLASAIVFQRPVEGGI